MKLGRILGFVAVIILIVNLAYFYPRITGQGFYEPEIVNVTEVIDGDTFKTEGSSIRLLCLNTPEKNKPFYEEAKIFLAEYEGKEIQILRDKDDEDKYGRKLRFAFYGESFINKEIVEKGLSHLYLCEGTRYYSDLKEAEEKAMENEVGIWKKSESRCSGCFELISLEPEAEFFTIKNNCDYECKGEVKDEANHFFQLSLKAWEEKTIESNNIWNDGGDRFFLRDEEGLLLYYSY